MGRSPTNTKAKLIETANDLIWQSSYGSVSVDDICNTAGIKKGSFYHYFSSKAELAVAAMDASYQHYQGQLTNILSAGISPIERFENLADFIYQKQKQAFDKYGRVCGCPFACLGSEMAGNEILIQQKADEILELQGNIFKAILQEMIDSGLLSIETDMEKLGAQIVTSMLGQVMVARIQNNLSHLKDDIRVSLFQTLDLKITLSGKSTQLQEQHNDK